MAWGLGIRMNDPNDPVASRIRIGITDLDPTRVLRECEHLFGWIGSVTPEGQRLGLPSAGTKVLHCLLHDYTMEGLELDRVHDEFKRAHCDTCPDRAARDPAWKFSKEWAEEQEEINQTLFLRRLRRS
jgi:hypothetical protein